MAGLQRRQFDDPGAHRGQRSAEAVLQALKNRTGELTATDNAIAPRAEGYVLDVVAHAEDGGAEHVGSKCTEGKPGHERVQLQTQIIS